MRNCFVTGCDQEHKRRNLPQKRPMFVPPKDKDLFSRWAEALPKLRPLKMGDRVCHRHFQSHEMQTIFQHIIDGQVYQLERDRARLNANAVPSRNLPDMKDLVLQKARLQQRKPAPKRENRVPAEDKHTDFTGMHELDDFNAEHALLDDSSCQPQEEEVVSTVEPSQPTPTEGDFNETFVNLFDDIFEVDLPNTLWGIHRCPERCILFFTYMDAERLCVTKMLTVDNSGAIKVYLASRLMSTHRISSDLQPTDALSIFLTELDEIRICPGAVDSNDCDVELRSATGHGEQQQELCGSCLVNKHF